MWWIWGVVGAQSAPDLGGSREAEGWKRLQGPLAPGGTTGPPAGSWHLESKIHQTRARGRETLRGPPAPVFVDRQEGDSRKCSICSEWWGAEQGG